MKRTKTNLQSSRKEKKKKEDEQGTLQEPEVKTARSYFGWSLTCTLLEAPVGAVVGELAPWKMQVVIS